MSGCMSTAVATGPDSETVENGPQRNQQAKEVLPFACQR